MNKHVFKGHKTLLGSKYVTYGEVELPLRFDIYPKAKSGFTVTLENIPRPDIDIESPPSFSAIILNKAGV